MRVLFEGDDLHVWAEFGALTIHAGGERVEWRSAYHPRLDFAPRDDRDVRLPPRFEGRVALDESVLDALALPKDRVAIVRRGTPPHVEIVALASGQVEHRFELVASAQPLVASKDAPSEPRPFEGSGPRGVRLFPSPLGLIVAASESGHVAEWSLEERRFGRVVSVPGAPENALFAAGDGELLHVGLAESGRHSFAWTIDAAGDVVASWPSDGELRWGLPGLVALPDAVLTFSDEGPHRSALALLTAELDESDEADGTHLPVRGSPTELAASGERFAALFFDKLVTGRVVDGCFVDVRTWTPKELLAAGGLDGIARTPHVTADGRGHRVFVEHRPDVLLVAGGTPLIDGPEGAVIAVEPASSRTLVTETELVDAHGGVAFVHDKGRVRWIDVATGAVKRKENAPLGATQYCRMLGDGVVHATPSQRSFDFLPLSFHDPKTGKTKRLADEPRKRPGPRTIDGQLWWYEYEETKEVLEETVERGVKTRHVRVVDVESSLWCVGAKLRADSFDLGREIEAFAVHDGVPFVLVRERAAANYVWHLERVGEDGLERLTENALTTPPSALAAAEGQLLFVSSEGVHAFTIETKSLRLLAPASFGLVTSLCVSGGRAYWLEIARDQELAAVCSLEL